MSARPYPKAEPYEVLQKGAKEAKPENQSLLTSAATKIVDLPGAPLRQGNMEGLLAEAGADDRLRARLAAIADFARALDGRANAAGLRLKQMAGEFRSAQAARMSLQKSAKAGIKGAYFDFLAIQGLPPDKILATWEQFGERWAETAVAAEASRVVRELELEAQAVMKGMMVYREIAGELRRLLSKNKDEKK